MIELLDIRKACNATLEFAYPNVPVKSQDVEKGFARPSFTVEFDDIQAVTLESLIETSLNVMIYYFPNPKMKDYYLHLDDARYKLSLAFGNQLKVLDRYLDINEPSASIVDGIIVFEFSMLFYQQSQSAIEESAAPMMENLHYRK